MRKIIMLLTLIGFLPFSYTTTYAKPATMSGFIEAEHSGKLIQFPMLKSHYLVDIQGDLATVHLEQWFENPTNVALDASYLFPLNKDSAVYAMQMKIGDEIIEAKIQRREKAEQVFEQAKHDGKAASLLTQHRPNMFTQRLANLMPGDSIRVTLKYTQHVPRVDKEYELVLPLVAGPRYIPANNEHHVNDTKPDSEQIFNKWELQEHPIHPPTTGVDLPKELESERVKITVRLQGGMPITSVTSQTHAISSRKINDQSREITLASGKTIDNMDFILHYSLASDAIQAGILTHQDERGNFFSLLIEPPALPAPDQITPREMVFVLDTSGSMRGAPLEASKIFMTHALENLRSSDYFRIIDFGNSPREYSQTALPATLENLKKGIDHVIALRAAGGTEIVPAIEQSFKPTVTPDTLRMVVFLTDGYIGNETDVLARINAIRGEARIYALGVGSSVNRYLLDEMAHAGHGFVRYIDPMSDIEDAAIHYANRLQTPVMTNLKINWGNLQVEDVSPASLPDLFVGDSLRILGKFKNPGKHTASLTGEINGQLATLPLQISYPSTENNEVNEIQANTEAIPLIWARSQIKELMRAFNQPPHLRSSSLAEDSHIKRLITQLGLNYSLMTKWTSFVAVSTRVVNEQAGNNKQINVPLPMPKGVSKSAYGQSSNSFQFAGSSAPEPSMLAGLLLMFIMGLVLFTRRFLSTVHWQTERKLCYIKRKI